MDVVLALRNRIDNLPPGDYSRGLKSVLSHIEVAFSHHQRGEIEKTESSFTDAVYRCNQAFEGSVKEAYRVLAEKDPSKLKPYEIEKHLESEKVFRERVLTLFTNYRQEWRNPSTHDYTLDFDQSEAFIAIMSISAFAKVLIDQIGQVIASRSAIKAAESLSTVDNESEKIVRNVAAALIAASEAGILQYDAFSNESELVGAAAGILQSKFPDFDFRLNESLAEDKRYRPDIVMRRGDESLIVEMKYGKGESLVFRGHDQAEAYLQVSDINNAVVFVLSPKSTNSLKTYPFGDKSTEILILTSELDDEFSAVEDLEK